MLSYHSILAILPKPGRAAHVALLDLAPNGVCRALFVAKQAVSSYLTFPPFPGCWLLLIYALAQINKNDQQHFRRFISVALSLESPPPGITRHPALWSSDFPHVIMLHATAQFTRIYFSTLQYFLLHLLCLQEFDLPLHHRNRRHNHHRSSHHRNHRHIQHHHVILYPPAF